MGHGHAERPRCERIFGLDLPVDKWAAEEGIADQEITERLLKEVDDKAKAKEAEFGPEAMRQIEKMVLLADPRPSLARASGRRWSICAA